MAESCPVLTPAERQIVDIIHRADQALMATVYKALRDATDQAAAEFQSIGSLGNATRLRIFRGGFTPPNVLRDVWSEPCVHGGWRSPCCHRRDPEQSKYRKALLGRGYRALSAALAVVVVPPGWMP